jgi:hypothetical protein
MVNHGRRFDPLQKLFGSSPEPIQSHNHGTQDTTERIHDPTGPYGTHNPLRGIRQEPCNNHGSRDPLSCLAAVIGKNLVRILGKFQVRYTDYGSQPGEPPLRPTYLSCGGTTGESFERLATRNYRTEPSPISSTRIWS